MVTVGSRATHPGTAWDGGVGTGERDGGRRARQGRRDPPSSRFPGGRRGLQRDLRRDHRARRARHAAAHRRQADLRAARRASLLGLPDGRTHRPLPRPGRPCRPQHRRRDQGPHGRDRGRRIHPRDPHHKAAGADRQRPVRPAAGALDHARVERPLDARRADGPQREGRRPALPRQRRRTAQLLRRGAVPLRHLRQPGGDRHLPRPADLGAARLAADRRAAEQAAADGGGDRGTARDPGPQRRQPARDHRGRRRTDREADDGGRRGHAPARDRRQRRRRRDPGSGASRGCDAIRTWSGRSRRSRVAIPR